MATAVGPARNGLMHSISVPLAARSNKVFLNTLYSTDAARSSFRSVVACPTFIPRKSARKTALARVSRSCISVTSSCLLFLFKRLPPFFWYVRQGLGQSQETQKCGTQVSAGPVCGLSEKIAPAVFDFG